MYKELIYPALGKPLSKGDEVLEYRVTEMLMYTKKI